MVRRGSTVRVRQRASRSPCRSAPSGWERDHRRAPRRPPSVHRLSGLSPPRFRGDCFDWFPTLIRGLVSGTYRLAWCRSNSAGGTPPSEVCRRSVLNHAWIELARENTEAAFRISFARRSSNTSRRSSRISSRSSLVGRSGRRPSFAFDLADVLAQRLRRQPQISSDVRDRTSRLEHQPRRTVQPALPGASSLSA
jgi:hypothetical protein